MFNVFSALISLIGTKAKHRNIQEICISILISWCSQIKKISYYFHVLQHSKSFLFVLNYCVDFHIFNLRMNKSLFLCPTMLRYISNVLKIVFNFDYLDLHNNEM